MEVLPGSDPGAARAGVPPGVRHPPGGHGGRDPQDVLDLAARVLAGRGDQDAVATAVGLYLPDLLEHAPDFTAAHREDLFGLSDNGRPSLAATWLRWGRFCPLLLAALDRDELLGAVHAGAPGAGGHLAHALTDAPDFLGEPAAGWAELADGPGGPAAVSRLLELIAARLPQAGAEGSAATTAAATGSALTLWRAALDAGLPAGALAGAGAFAGAALEDTVWLQLPRAGAEHTAALTDADFVAERAAGHPGSPDALLLTACLIARPAGAWQDDAVRRHARILLDAAAAPARAEPSRSVGELREALVNAGDVAAARA